MINKTVSFLAIREFRGGTLALLGAFVAAQVSAAVHYVDATSVNPTPPYSSWVTAAVMIQDAVDAALAGDTVLVTNGTYLRGGRTGSGTLTNRVLVDKAITVQSINGAAVTLIQGYQVPGITNGSSAVRCVSLADGVRLCGFTLTNGATGTNGAWDVDQSGGGAWCASASALITDCVLVGNSAWDSGGGVFQGTLSNCTIKANIALDAGGGAYGSMLNNCVVSSNSAIYGGGSFGGYSGLGALNNCVLSGNVAFTLGGGADGGVLTRCIVTNNVARGDPNGAGGGGLESGCAFNCLIAGNVADCGGGASDSDVYNCAVFNNLALVDGGGLEYCAAYNCTVTGNVAGHSGGGSDSSGLSSCIVYYNTAPSGANWSGLDCSGCSPISSTCTTPLPTGAGNITNEPMLADFSHLADGSPCRGAGNPADATGVDIDGEAWASPPSMGCDEYRAGAVTGDLKVAILADYTNVAAGFAIACSAQIAGHASANQWDFGDLTGVSNRPYATHSWTTPGSYNVIFRAFNESYPAGISATVAVSVVSVPVHYVSPASASPTAPYNSWATAAINIQDAVDAASVTGALVLVTNGIYQSGGRVVAGTLTNRLAVTKPVKVRSVNGPAVTVIRGGQTNGDSAIRCVYLTNGATLEGFTLTNGATRLAGDAAREQAGGGAWCEPISAVLSNCVLVGNTAMHGGAAYGGTFNNCTIQGNSTGGVGGGAEAGTFNNCVIASNSAGGYGGGVYYCTLNGCTVAGNQTAGWGGGAGDSSVLNNCVVAGNSANSGAGGGAYSSMLHNCLLTGNTAGSGGGASFCAVDSCLITTNSAANHGGGAGWGALNNCTVAGNSAGSEGGGAYSSAMENCTVYYNTAPSTPNYGTTCSSCYPVNYCCTTTIEPGLDSFTNAPLFVNPAAGNFRLQSNSPCINAGHNTTAASGLDLDGNPRIAGGTVDVGAYEFPSPSSVISYQWLQYYGLATDGSADFLDPDGDGMSNWQEWRAGTNPTNQSSVLSLLSLVTNAAGWTVTWQSVGDRTYFVQRATSLAGPMPFVTVAPNVAGQAGTTSFADTNVLSQSRLFYRIGVQN